jgi:hypothetical protein
LTALRSVNDCGAVKTAFPIVALGNEKITPPGYSNG